LAIGIKNEKEIIGVCYSLLNVMKYRHMREELAT
jgi:hypothetical protein